MRGDQSFASRSHHAIGRNVCSGHFNMSTGYVINEGLFSTDDCRLSFESNSKRFYVCRKSGIRFHPRHICEREAYGSDSVCVWGGISLVGRTDLRVCPWKCQCSHL
ncbi:hypothetical protein TNCV_2635381 [Trichonephila clavipes]|nr:hypothetical protein TNCV_2635381 [Trichonephila clavipes]